VFFWALRKIIRFCWNLPQFTGALRRNRGIPRASVGRAVAMTLLRWPGSFTQHLFKNMGGEGDRKQEATMWARSVSLLSKQRKSKSMKKALKNVGLIARIPTLLPGKCGQKYGIAKP